MPENSDDSAQTTALDGALDRVAPRVRAKDGDRYAQTGQFALGNRAALRHGRYSRKALRKARAALLEAWREKYRDASGIVTPVVDAHLKQLAKLEATSDRVIAWIEGSKLSPMSAKHAKALDVLQGVSDRIGRHLTALAALVPETAAPATTTTVVFGGRYAPASSEMRPLIVDRVSTRHEMQQALGLPDVESGEDDDARRMRVVDDSGAEVRSRTLPVVPTETDSPSAQPSHAVAPCVAVDAHPETSSKQPRAKIPEWYEGEEQANAASSSGSLGG